MKNIKTFNQYNLNESIFNLSAQDEQIVINIAQYILNNHFEKISNCTRPSKKLLKYFSGDVFNLNILEEDVEKSLEKTNESVELLDIFIGIIKFISGVIVLAGTGLMLSTIKQIFKELIKIYQYKRDMRRRGGVVVAAPLNMEQDPFGEEIQQNGNENLPFNYRRIIKLFRIGCLLALCTTPFFIGLTMKMGKSSHDDEKGKITNVEQVDLYNVRVKGKNKTYILLVSYKELSKYKVGDSTEVDGLSEEE